MQKDLLGFTPFIFTAAQTLVPVLLVFLLLLFLPLLLFFQTALQLGQLEKASTTLNIYDLEQLELNL